MKTVFAVVAYVYLSPFYFLKRNRQSTEPYSE
jgi:hypothetical protein